MNKVNTRRNFLEYVRELPPARKERWVWGFSVAGIALVLFLGWMSFGVLLPQGDGATEMPETAGDIPLFEAARGGIASVGHLAGSAIESLRSFFFSPRTYPVAATE